MKAEGYASDESPNGLVHSQHAKTAADDSALFPGTERWRGGFGGEKRICATKDVHRFERVPVLGLCLKYWRV